jgi:hypothetical protein
VEAAHEMLYIVHIVTDVDGSLKFKKLEDFFDSKAYLEFMGVVRAAAHTNK